MDAPKDKKEDEGGGGVMNWMMAGKRGEQERSI